jgi:predicted glutamine amidotransferase
MCIIVAKARKVKMPDGKTLLRCFEHNSDGAGIMWAENGAVHIRKGFMNYTEFDSFICKLGNRLDLTNTALVMHFRITTHANTSPQNCHPFPITRKISHLKRTELTTDTGVAHNGIIPIKCIPKLSDTQTYIAKRLAAIKNIQPDFYTNDYIMQKIENDIQSKMCFLTTDEQIYTIGKFIEEDGVLYSNSSYEEYYNLPWLRYFNLYDSDISVCPVYGMVMGNGDIAESNGFEYFIDENGKVYEYDYISDSLIAMNDLQAFTFNGTPYRFDDREAITMSLQKGGNLW